MTLELSHLDCKDRYCNIKSSSRINSNTSNNAATLANFTAVTTPPPTTVLIVIVVLRVIKLFTITAGTGEKMLETQSDNMRPPDSRQTLTDTSTVLLDITSALSKDNVLTLLNKKR
jgi:hypothetical protein